MLAFIATLLMLVLLYIQPRILGAAAEHWGGRLVLIALIVLCGYIHPAAGILAVIAYISCADSREGMTTAAFRHTNCRTDPDGRRRLVDSADQNVPFEKISEIYPLIKFKEAPCNPCDSDCKFDQLETESLIQGREIAPSKPAPTTRLQLLKQELAKNAAHDPLTTPDPLPVTDI